MSLVGPCSSSSSGYDCCVGTAYIKPGEQSQVILDFSYWLAANAGFTLAPQFPATLTFQKYTTEGLVPVPAGELTTVPDYEDFPATATQIKGNELRIIVLVDQDVTLNSQFRIDVMVTARDCDARIITKKECFLVQVSDC